MELKRELLPRHITSVLQFLKPQADVDVRTHELLNDQHIETQAGHITTRHLAVPHRFQSA